MLGEKWELGSVGGFAIGDTPHDISAAKAVGGISIGVATGNFSFEDLSKETPDYLFQTLEDISSFSEILGIE